MFAFWRSYRTTTHDNIGERMINYLNSDEKNLPHILNFSGGRSSGMLLLTALERGLLRAARGDAVIFSNTSAEHLATYDFVRECKAYTESYGIPFFILEYCTFEKYKKTWIRQSSYRLCNAFPFSTENPDGFRWEGETFESMLSMALTVPNLFQRNCTIALKISITDKFTKDWFSGKPDIPLVGHFENPKITLDTAYAQFKKNGGMQTRKDFWRKRSFLQTMPPGRGQQYFRDFTIPNACPPQNPSKKYVALIGFRADEPKRIIKMRLRRMNKEVPCGSPKNQIDTHRLAYAPLATENIHKEQVIQFWKRQKFDLNLPVGGECGNCVFCFLKNRTQLSRALMSNDDNQNGPMNIKWWAEIEKKYQREFKQSDKPDAPTIYRSFFRKAADEKPLTYQNIADDGLAALGQGTLLDLESPPCECTD